MIYSATVGGPIMPPGAVTVLIGGKPAACVGDMATCSGPPDAIAPPGCPTVLIGPGGGGGGGGGGAGSGAASGTAETAAGEGGGAGEAAEQEPEGHFLDVKYVDKAGKPITGVGYVVKGPDGKTDSGLLAGRIRRDGVDAGSYEIGLRCISKAEWSVERAKVGDTVTLRAVCAGLESGTKAALKIFVRDYNVPDRVVAELPAEVANDAIEADWVFAVDEKILRLQSSQQARSGYSSPRFYFVAEAEGCAARSPFLFYSDWLEIRLADSQGKAAAGKAYKVVFPNGEIREGTLDSDGKARLENVPPGKAQIFFEPQA